MVIKAYVEPPTNKTNKSRAAISTLGPNFLVPPSIRAVIPKTSSWNLTKHNLKTTGLAKKRTGMKRPSSTTNFLKSYGQSLSCFELGFFFSPVALDYTYCTSLTSSRENKRVQNIYKVLIKLYKMYILYK